MPKKKSNEEETVLPIVEVNESPKPYPKSDADTMRNLFRTTALHPLAQQEILNFYRKYINSTQPEFKTCAACSGTFMQIFKSLRDWFSQNTNKFQK